MERMLYIDRVNSAAARRGACRRKAARRCLGRRFRGDKNAAELLNAVPAAQRSAGYLFAEAEYLRKQEKFTEAAAVMLKAPQIAPR